MVIQSAADSRGTLRHDENTRSESVSDPGRSKRRAPESRRAVPRMAVGTGTRPEGPTRRRAVGARARDQERPTIHRLPPRIPPGRVPPVSTRAKLVGRPRRDSRCRDDRDALQGDRDGHRRSRRIRGSRTSDTGVRSARKPSTPRIRRVRSVRGIRRRDPDKSDTTIRKSERRRGRSRRESTKKTAPQPSCSPTIASARSTNSSRAPAGMVAPAATS